jgi:hypothetical protein
MAISGDRSIDRIPNVSGNRQTNDSHCWVVGTCLNCEDAAVPNRRALYCGERCRQVAELVRYARRTLAEGTYDRPDIAEAIAIRRSQLVVGFYDKRARAVSDDVRQELLVRCKRCRQATSLSGSCCVA